MPDINTGIPFRILQASTAKWYADFSSDDITPTDYTVQYTFSDGTDSQTVTATDAGVNDLFLITVASGVSAQLPVMKDIYYTAMATHTSNGECYVVDRGSIYVEPNLVYDPTQDTRSHIKKVLDELEDVIEGRLAQSETSYSIGTGTMQRSIAKLSPEELMSAYKYYRRMYQREKDKERLRKGKGSSNKIYGKF